MTPAEYRKRAEECGKKAEKATLPTHKAAWLKLAEQWRTLAQDGDSKKNGS